MHQQLGVLDDSESRRSRELGGHRASVLDRKGWIVGTPHQRGSRQSRVDVSELINSIEGEGLQQPDLRGELGVVTEQRLGQSLSELAVEPAGVSEAPPRTNGKRRRRGLLRATFNIDPIPGSRPDPTSERKSNAWRCGISVPVKTSAAT
ncbi:MAG: hypothetical protein WBG36_09455 [Ornithinimicrobium sp.]